HHPADYVLQLAHVAAPGILEESGRRLRGELLVPPVLLVDLGEEACRQDEDLLFAVSQRRDAYLHHVQAIVEIFAERTPGEGLLEVLIRRSDDPDVHIDHAAPPDPGEAEILQDMQEFGLEGEGKVGDLIEVDRPLVGVLELPRLPLVRSGEGPLFVAEQLRLEKPRRDGRAVDLDERATATPRGSVDSAGNDILAHPALA